MVIRYFNGVRNITVSTMNLAKGFELINMLNSMYKVRQVLMVK